MPDAFRQVFWDIILATRYLVFSGIQILMLIWACGNNNGHRLGALTQPANESSRFSNDSAVHCCSRSIFKFLNCLLWLKSSANENCDLTGNDMQQDVSCHQMSLVWLLRPEGLVGWKIEHWHLVQVMQIKELHLLGTPLNLQHRPANHRRRDWKLGRALKMGIENGHNFRIGSLLYLTTSGKKIDVARARAFA